MVGDQHFLSIRKTMITKPFLSAHRVPGIHPLHRQEVHLAPLAYQAQRCSAYCGSVHNHVISLIYGLQLQKKRDKSFNTSNPCRFNITPGIMASLGSASLEVQENPAISASKDLLIIGPGVLGKQIAELWTKEFPGCSVTGQTATTNHHAELESLGIKPSLKGTQKEKGFSFVVFCAPPSGSADYAGELRLASEQWNGQGVFLFTSSSAVYDCADNGVCNEDTPIVNVGRSPRTDILLRAEQEVLQAGGTVVRLAGLYTKDRGPHAFWIKKGVVDARPDHILNLIHYEDAASLCVTILKKGFRKEVFMGCDNQPLSRQEVVNIAIESGKFEEKFEAFTGVDGPLGKKMNCNRTRSKTGWQPKYKSFAEFLHVVS